MTLQMFRPVRSKRRSTYHSNIVAVEVSLRSQILGILQIIGPVALFPYHALGQLLL